VASPNWQLLRWPWQLPFEFSNQGPLGLQAVPGGSAAYLLRSSLGLGSRAHPPASVPAGQMVKKCPVGAGVPTVQWQVEAAAHSSV
jgi:hypothetical protein